jgi:hypothetical protein
MTIPGQYSRSRDFALRRAFAPETQIEGVIFLASFGYDHIWPRVADIVANQLPRYDIDRLRRRNRREELESFKEICREVRRKIEMDSALAPKWLMVVVNKLDLYFDDLIRAERYYLPGRGSLFDREAQRLIADVGTRALAYYVLPVATQKTDYRFASSRGPLQKASLLQPDQCIASIGCLEDQLGDIIGT